MDPSPDIRRRRSESPPRRVHSSALDPMTLRAPHCRLQEGEVKDALRFPPLPSEQPAVPSEGDSTFIRVHLRPDGDTGHVYLTAPSL